MVKLNLHALYLDLTVVYTLIVLCICQQQSGIRHRITVDRYFIAYCVSYLYGRSRPKHVAKYHLIL